MVLVPCVIYRKIDLRLDNWKDRIALLGNGAVGAVACISLLYALPNAPLGNINAIIQGTLSVFTAILACVFLKEMSRPSELVASLLNAIGVLIITRPPFLVPAHAAPSSKETMAYILTIVAVVGISAGYVIGRYVRGRLHVFAVMFYNSSIVAVLNCVLMVIIRPPSWSIPPRAASFIIGVCVSGLLSTWTRYKSLQLESAATVVLLSNVQIIISYLADIFIFHYTLHPLDFVGAGVVVMGSVVVSISAYRKRKQDNDANDENIPDEEKSLREEEEDDEY
ncbi:solute carrier family 35 member G1-like [Saccoglossus kowalevskii]|uniref:Solute carrier family 35 member G1-like n=1 Tax=Saccoglossus kowalevskii TaxID=10224 RepID=A0ABM0MWV1_SACKO|nr:PREDICTED: solute carrier family 35 member G1-like [Saccoglossus kowalevskii]